MLKSFFHTGFIVKDLEAAVAFYSDVLGLTLTMRTERTGDFPTTLLGFPDTHIKGAFFEMGEGHQLELIQYINPEGGYADFDKNDVRAAHLAFYVEDIDALLRKHPQPWPELSHAAGCPCMTTRATWSARRPTARTPTATGSNWWSCTNQNRHSHFSSRHSGFRRNPDARKTQRDAGRRLMLLLIDNYDSFTWNLYQYLCELGAEVEVVRNDKTSIEDIEALRPEGIVVSPGPCTPREAGISNDVIRHFGPKLPVLGVCLGHQCIGDAYGATVDRAGEIRHGKTSMIHHDGKGVFEGPA